MIELVTRIEEFDPPHRWSWVAQFLTVRVHYNHRLDPIADRARLTWSAAADGPGAATLGRIVGVVLTRYLAREIPNLQAELRARA